MATCIKNIDKNSTNEELKEFYQTLFECWKKHGDNMYYDPNINKILSELLLIQGGKYHGYPNGTYVKLLYFTVNMDIDTMREDIYNKFLKSFL